MVASKEEEAKMTFLETKVGDGSGKNEPKRSYHAIVDVSIDRPGHKAYADMLQCM